MNHLFHRIRVELRAQSRAAGVAAQEAAARALQHDLDTLESVLDARFPTNTTRRLDRLEVDLGALPLRGFRQAFMTSLAKSLSGFDANLLQSRPPVRIRESPRGSQRNAQAAAGSEDVVEAFLHYIVHGWLPWFFPLDRWRDEIPKALISGEALLALCSRLPSLVLEEPARLLRLMPFPSLAMALFGSEFRVPEESAVELTGTRLPTGSAEVRARLALWFLHLIPRPAAKVEDPKTRRVLLDLLAGDWGRPAPREPRDFQPVIKALAVLRKVASSPEIERLSRLIMRASRPASGRRATASAESAKSASFEMAEDLAENGIPTESAGIVLLHPFLIRFFQRFGWLDDRLRILEKYRWHAVHALHWIVHKHPVRDELDLVLEKALCSIPGEVARWPGLEDNVVEEADALLRAVIAHWKALKDTSPDGLREAFLARPGLFYPVEPPRLHVETRAYDMLLSRLPWSFDRVALPWLRSPIQVRWQQPS